MKEPCEDPLTCECTNCLKAAKLRSDFYAQRFMHQRDLKGIELETVKDQLFKATQMLNYLQFRSDDTWRLYPFYMVNTLLAELPALPDEEE